MKLSIITPYYKTFKEIQELSLVLEPQLTKDIEWIIIDDGCNEKRLDKFKAKVIHLEKNSGVAGKPRNIGLDNAKGKYIAFIDSDDLVTENYIEEILDKIKLDKDIIFLSWKSQVHNIIIKKNPPNWNCAVWCRVYKKSIISKIRFREDLKKAEDWEFNRHIHPKSSVVIQKQIYIYNSGRIGSLTNG